MKAPYRLNGHTPLHTRVVLLDIVSVGAMQRGTETYNVCSHDDLALGPTMTSLCGALCTALCCPAGPSALCLWRGVPTTKSSCRVRIILVASDVMLSKKGNVSQ